MNYSCFKVEELSTSHWAAWTQLVDSESTLDSPFFRPEFSRHVAAVRSDVSVGVLEDGGMPVGFFPFQRRGRSVQPVVGRLSECHGIIAAPATKWNPVKLLAACGIQALHFDHLPEAQVEFRRHAWGDTPSPYLDLSRGYEAYRAALKASGSSFADAERKGRKLGREVGPLRFVWHDESPTTLNQLIEWKSAQHRGTSMLEIFRHQWLCDLLGNLQRSQAADFSAPVSALYAGERLVAVHLGLVTRTMLHWWFPTYATEFEKYSPGLTLLLNVAEQAAARGLQRIELGPGESRYKDNFKSGDRPVFEGMVSRNQLTLVARSAWYHTKRYIRESKYRARLEAPLTATRQLRQWMAFR